MKTFDYVAMRAQGIAIVVGLCVALGLVLGLLWWISEGAVGHRFPVYTLGSALYVGVLALVTNTPIARWIARDLENFVAIIVLLILVTVPFWVLVFPMQALALRLGWIHRIAPED